MYGCQCYGWAFYITYLPSFLEDHYGVEATSTLGAIYKGGPLWMGAIGCLVGGLLTDWFIRRTGNRRLGRSLFGVIGHAMTVVCFLARPYMPSAFWFFLAVSLAGFFTDLTMGPAWALCQDIGRRYAAIVAGCMNMVGGFGGALANWVTGFILQRSLAAHAAKLGLAEDQLTAAQKDGRRTGRLSPELPDLRPGVRGGGDLLGAGRCHQAGGSRRAVASTAMRSGPGDCKSGVWSIFRLTRVASPARIVRKHGPDPLVAATLQFSWRSGPKRFTIMGPRCTLDTSRFYCKEPRPLFDIARAGGTLMHQLLGIVSVVVALAADAGQGLKPWAANKHPTDAAKSHVEEITTAQHPYAITQGGTMDGENCRSPVGCSMSGEGACEQTWQSNRAVRMENIGTTDVVNPWLSNGRNNFRTMEEIIAAAVTPGMSDKEKAMALWFQEIRYRYHHGGNNTEVGNPVKVFNIYGHNTCGNDSICLAGLWHKAGFQKVAPVRAMGHCVSHVFFDGRWNMLDGDQHAIYLLRDNETIANDQDITRDHDLVKRTHTEGILIPDSRERERAEWQASDYYFEGEINGDRNCQSGNMNMVLRPHEAITWRWGHLDPPKYLGDKPKEPDMICNGLWEYRPVFANELWRKGADTIENIKSGPEGLMAEGGKTGTAIWSIRSSYVLVGGRLEFDHSGAKFAISWDGKKWEDAGENLDKFFPSGGTPRYQYYLRCELLPGTRLTRLGVINDVQMAPLTLPGMIVGQNNFTYTDQSEGERKVRITHEWVERSAAKPPAAPPAAIYPADGGQAEGTDVVFRWEASSDPDGNKIADYHFELSNRPDLKWPLSMNFYKLISKTADHGKAQYTLPGPGLLTPDRTYYWHVRAKNDKGVWGPWGKTWSFTPQGPAYPLEVTLSYDQSKGTGILRWKAEPRGPPAGEIPRVRQRREGLYGQRCALQSQHRRIERIAVAVSGKLPCGNARHRAYGDR